MSVVEDLSAELVIVAGNVVATSKFAWWIAACASAIAADA